MSSLQPVYTGPGQRHAVSHRRAARKYASQLGLLPKPPTDREKYSYAKRHLWVLTLFSLVSFCCLVASQFKLAQSTPWMWIYVPLLVFTVVYYLISLRVNALTRDFDMKAHKRLVREWRPEVHPSV